VYVGGCSTYGCRVTSGPGGTPLEFESDGRAFAPSASFFLALTLFAATPFLTQLAPSSVDADLAVMFFATSWLVLVLELAPPRTAVLDKAGGVLELWTGGLGMLAGPAQLRLQAPEDPGRRVRAFVGPLPYEDEAVFLDVCSDRGEQRFLVAAAPRSEWQALRAFGESLAVAMKTELEVRDPCIR
jgi:hypothetical protein